jgi:hypothetical protein
VSELKEAKTASSLRSTRHALSMNAVGEVC